MNRLRGVNNNLDKNYYIRAYFGLNIKNKVV